MMAYPIAEFVKIYRFFEAEGEEIETGMEDDEWHLMILLTCRLIVNGFPEKEEGYGYNVHMGWDRAIMGKGFYHILYKVKGDPDRDFRYCEEMEKVKKAMKGRLSESDYAGQISDEYRLPKPGTDAHRLLKRMLKIYMDDKAAWDETKQKIGELCGQGAAL